MDNETKQEFINRIHEIIDATEDGIQVISSHICEVQGNMHLIEGLVYMLETDKK